jgi:hypothetical protein
MDSNQASRPPQRTGLWTAVWAIAAITCLAMAIFAAAFFHGREADLGRELRIAREQLRIESIAADRMNQAFGILRAPDALVFAFGREHLPQGAVFASGSHGVLLVAYGLAPAASGKVYETWLVPKHGMPQSAGTFAGTSDNTALHVYAATVDLTAIEAVEVTLENQGGAPQPTSPPVIRVSL